MGSRFGGGPSLRVGLTGGIASGKTTVADLLAARGAVIVDADILAREVVEPGTAGLTALRKRFGPAILSPDGRLDRGALARLIFADPAARTAAERIIHPEVRRRAQEIESQARAGSVVVHVIPLLVETGQAEAFDAVVVVDVDPDTQVARLRSRNAMSSSDARARIAAQATREERLAAADFVIENEGTRADLESSVDRVWDRLQHRDRTAT